MTVKNSPNNIISFYCFIIIVFLNSLILTLHTSAQTTDERWIFYGETRYGNLLHYDIQSVRKEGNRISFWEKIICTPDHEYDYYLMLSYLNCRERTMAKGINLIVYYKDGRVKDLSISKQNGFEESWLVYDNIYPETLDETLYSILCNN